MIVISRYGCLRSGAEGLAQKSGSAAGAAVVGAFDRGAGVLNVEVRIQHVQYRRVRRNRRAVGPLRSRWIDGVVINDWLAVVGAHRFAARIFLGRELQIVLRHLTAIPLRAGRLNVQCAKQTATNLTGWLRGRVAHRVEQVCAFVTNEKGVSLRRPGHWWRSRRGNWTRQARTVVTDERPVIAGAGGPFLALDVQRKFLRAHLR